MVTDKKDGMKGMTKEHIVIGLDLTDEFSQVAFWETSKAEPENVSMVMGSQQMCIPTVLGKYYGENSWTFGKDALGMEEKNEGFAVSSLVTLAREGTPVEVETRDYDPVDLLALYMKKCLGLLALKAPLEKVSKIMITVEDPDALMIEILTKAISILRIKPEKVCFQSHSESAYYYMLHQAAELWNHQVLICHLREDGLMLRIMQKNVHTSPIVVLMEEKMIPDFKAEDMGKASPTRKKRKDEAFYKILTDIMEGKMFSSVYLLGDGFDGEWCDESLKYMCRNRRVFGGNNLFSKGACFGMAERIRPGEQSGKYVYLGEEKLKANIGMKVLRRGEESYFAVLDAGINWYEAKTEFEIILGSGNRVDFLITSLTGGHVTDKPMVLEGLPERPENTTRLKVQVEMSAVNKATITVEDLGFGELFPTSGKGWTYTMEV